ncbi:MAG: hypothetical protein OEM82_13575 [Acidobacteriota bacterium]|nr:hypothetical protein [Acidobacteriota bacterium]MDH3528971.1 hypothetical protein [Acidobacteriota bacterium]
MATNITQLEDPERNKTVLRVKGEMSLSDAELLEKIALDLRTGSDKNLTLDLADLDFLDSEAAPVIKRLEEHHGFEIEGLQFFVQKVVDETENRK